MSFKRFVETGRVAFVADGTHRGKLVSIVDVIDQTRALVDGPETGVPRGQMRLNQLHLTKFKISFPFSGPTRIVRRAWQKGKIDEKWKESLWAKKIESKRKTGFEAMWATSLEKLYRRSMTDFDRFKLRKARQIRNKIRTVAFYRLKKQAAKERAKRAEEKKTKGTKKGAGKKPAKK